MVGSRVTPRMLSDTALRGFQLNIGRNQKIQEQIASGKKLTRPSDDPASATAAMRLRSQNRLDTQYLDNIDFATGRIDAADTALGDISDALRTAKQLAVNAQDSSLPDSSRAAFATELRSIRTGVIDAYNASWLGRPIFGGTVQGSVAVDGTGTYIGNESPVTARIGRAETVRTDVSGVAAGADVLPQLLDDLADDIANGATDLNGYQNQLDAVMVKVTAAFADVGTRGAQLTSAKNRLNVEQLDLKTQITNREDVDIAQASVELQSSQVAYQASLGAAAKVLQTSLLDYLR
jgi:flagellar hook-associated protein 3 FlgL